MAGIAPDIFVTPIRIFRGDSVASCAQVGDAIRFAWYYADDDVLSDSWYWPSPCDDITNAINDGETQGRGGKGTTIVFAAGNTSNRDQGIIGSPTYPATLASTIAVGAINRYGDLTNYTPEGSGLDLVAPSGHYAGWCNGDVVTRDPLGPAGVCNDGPDGDIDYTSTFTGTSAAAPQVAAVAALLYSREGSPNSSEARGRLHSGADPWGSSTQFGYGKLNAYNTLVPKPGVTLSGPSNGCAYCYVTVTASVSGGISPYTYAWTINGGLACANQSSCSGQLGGPDTWTTFTVTVTDAGGGYGRTSSASHSVYACPPQSPATTVSTAANAPAAICK